jgi:hypothetical protein
LCASTLAIDPSRRWVSCWPLISIEKITTGSALLHRDVLGDVEREGGLAHRRAAGDDDQVLRLHAGRLHVEVDEAGRHARHRPTGCRAGAGRRCARTPSTAASRCSFGPSPPRCVPPRAKIFVSASSRSCLDLSRAGLQRRLGDLHPGVVELPLQRARAARSRRTGAAFRALGVFCARPAM